MINKAKISLDFDKNHPKKRWWLCQDTIIAEVVIEYADLEKNRRNMKVDHFQSILITFSLQTAIMILFKI